MKVEPDASPLFPQCCLDFLSGHWRWIGKTYLGSLLNPGIKLCPFDIACLNQLPEVYLSPISSNKSGIPGFGSWLMQQFLNGGLG